MKRIHTLSVEEIQNLNYHYKNSPKPHLRVRYQGILLSNEGYSVAEISRLLKKDKDTIYSWLKRYELSSLLGMKNESGQGRIATLADLSKKQIKQLEKAVENDPQNLIKVSEKLSKKFKLKINKRMLIRFLKKTKIHLSSNS